MLKKIITIAAIALLPFSTQAFDPNNILSDADLTNYRSMSLSDIRQFLSDSFLSTYTTENWEGDTRSAAEIIYDAARGAKVSPKFLLVLLQKEQSLIKDSTPSTKQLDWATGYGVCDSCSLSASGIQRWKGFGKQVNSAALQFTEGYLADIEEFGYTAQKYGPGIPVTIGNETVTPANAATAALYAYTPHIHGNRLFYTIWNDWFEVFHQDGTLLRNSTTGSTYLLENGLLHPIADLSVLASRFPFRPVATVSSSELSKYDEGSPIIFPNYALLQNSSSGEIFLLVDDRIRHIADMETFRRLGFKEDEIMDATATQLSGFARGTEITLDNLEISGRVYELPTGSLFYVNDGVRSYVHHPDLVKLALRDASTIKTDASTIAQYREGDAIKLPDGILVKGTSTPTVYLTSNKILHPIESESTFIEFGWSFDDVQTVDDSVIEYHSIGESLD
jgi:hypothetical protein